MQIQNVGVMNPGDMGQAVALQLKNHLSLLGGDQCPD
jgi:hypothetical protein